MEDKKKPLKPGDVVICLPGYEDGHDGDGHYGGCGYWPGRIFTIREGSTVLWPLEGFNHPDSTTKPLNDKVRKSCGIHRHAVELLQAGLTHILDEIREEIYGN